jgi:nickel transport protein
MVVISFVFAASAFGHGIEVFAVSEGSLIHGTATFDDGKPMQNQSVVVWDGDGQPVDEITTDDDGKFSYPNESKRVLRFAVTTIDGHKASFTLDQSAASRDLAHELNSLGDGAGQAQDLEAYLEHEFAEIRQELHRLERSRSFRDMVGGIGYIVGVMGVIALIKSRKP